MTQEHITYEKVSVPSETVARLVEAALEYAVSELKIAKPEVVYPRRAPLEGVNSFLGQPSYQTAEEEHLRWSRLRNSIPANGGYTPANFGLFQIWLSEKIPETGHYLNFAVLHECRHLW